MFQSRKTLTIKDFRVIITKNSKITDKLKNVGQIMLLRKSAGGVS